MKMAAGDLPAGGFLAGKTRRMKLFLALVLLVPFLAVLLLNDYVPGTDETWQLQAASRLSSGKGYTCSWKSAHDLAQPKYDYLIAWPPGYSVVVAGLLKTGISLDSACKFLKILLVVLGVILWSNILDRYFETRHAKCVLLAFLCFSSISYAHSPTDLAFWALFPLMLSSISGGNIGIEDSRRVLSLPKIVIGSLTVSVLILFRYQGLVLIPIGSVWMMMYYRRNLWKGICRVSLFLLLPVATYLFIWYTNIKFGGTLSTMTNGSIQGFSLDWIYISGPLKAVFIGPLDKVIPQLLQMAGLGRFQAFVMDGSALLGALVIAIVFVRLWKKEEKSRVMLQWFVIGITCLVGFLGFLTMFYWSHNDWKPIEESRYYWFLIPLLVAMVLGSIESKVKTSRQNVKRAVSIISYITILAFWFIIIGYSCSQHDKYSLYNKEKASILGDIVSTSMSDEGAGRLVVGDNPFINMLLWEDFVPAYREVEITLNKEALFSRTTFVYMVEGERERGAIPELAFWLQMKIGSQIVEGERERGPMSDLALRLQMKKDNRIIDGHSITIYWRRFENGPLFGNP